MTTLLTSSTGGHLRELLAIAEMVEGCSGAIWAVPESAQSLSLLRDKRWIPVPYNASRNWKSAVRRVRPSLQLLAEHGITRLISTGASVSMPFLVAATLQRVERHYIESAARLTGPSLTGRLAERLPGTRVYTQFPQWQNRRWHYAGNIFDTFEAADPSPVATSRPLRVAVTLGTEPFPFDRAVRALQRVLPADAEVFWQVGATDAADLKNAHDLVPESVLLEAMREADVVVAHAGVGSALAALSVGRCPVLLPRLGRFLEAVDDHQAQIADFLQERGQAIHVSPENLERRDLVAAAGLRVNASPAPPRMVLQ